MRDGFTAGPPPGSPLVPGEYREGVIAGFPVLPQAVAVPAAAAMCRVTAAVSGAGVPALHLLWPDQSGKFPGEGGCDPQIAVLQDLAWFTAACRG